MKEVAVILFNQAPPKSATQRLRQRINEAPYLKRKLEKYGYRAYQQLLVYAQVELIFTHFWGKNWKARFNSSPR